MKMHIRRELILWVPTPRENPRAGSQPHAGTASPSLPTMELVPRGGGGRSPEIDASDCLNIHVSAGKLQQALVTNCYPNCLHL